MTEEEYTPIESEPDLDKRATWKVVETGETWALAWQHYDNSGKQKQCRIIIENATIDLIAAVKQAWLDTQEEFLK